MNKKIIALTMAERKELILQIAIAQRRGLRFDPKIVAEVKASVIVPKPEPKLEPRFEPPTKEQLNQILKHFGCKQTE